MNVIMTYFKYLRRFSIKLIQVEMHADVRIVTSQQMLALPVNTVIIRSHTTEANLRSRQVLIGTTCSI